MSVDNDLQPEVVAGAKKRSKPASPTARTLAECRRRGWIAQVVEKFVRFPPPGHRVDLFGVLDLVAIVSEVDTSISYPFGEDPPRRGVALLGIQACSGGTSGGGSTAARRDKILAEPRARAWVEAGGLLELWSWSKRGDRGKRKLWALRVETYADMVATIAQPHGDDRPTTIDTLLPREMIPDALAVHLQRKPRC